MGGAAGADGPFTASNLAGPSSRYEAIVGPFPLAEFLDEASKVLGPERIGLGVVANYKSQPDFLVAGPVDAYECTLKTRRVTLEAYKLHSSGCPVVQQAIKIGSSIVYRGIGNDCGITTKLIQGDDPLVFVANGQKVTILEVSFSSGIGAEHNHWLTAHVFAKSEGASSGDTARAAIKHLTEVTGVDRMFVSLRSDAQFPDDCSFPAWPAFTGFRGLPPQEVNDRGTFVCLTQGSAKIGCDGR